MRFHIITQYMENYGAHDWDGKGQCPQYWKMKGGEDYIVDVPGFRYDDEMSYKKGREVIDTLAPKIEHKSEYSQEYIIDWCFVEDDYQTHLEISQIEYDGDVLFPARRVTYDELMETV